MNCPSCNAPIPSDAAFCPNCGAKPGSAAASRPSAEDARTFSGLSTIVPMRESRATVLEPGTMFAERYEVIRTLGEGGMGIVYVAKDTHTSEEMVLKLIHPDLVTGESAIKRLLAEGLTARQIRHPNIVAVYDVSQWNGQPYFTMEFVKGGTLRSWMVNAIRSGRETSLATATGLMKSMLAGLAEAHRMGVVHRDLKPENVLLSGDPDAGDFGLKILDFGIAKAISAPPTSRSGSGGAIGTPLYMAPEQMTSAEAVGPAADLYSLSVIFYELLMEALPQSRWEPVGTSRPGIPKAIDDLIAKGLSARPRSRFSSAAAYEAALDAACRPGPIPEPIPEPPPPPPRPGFFAGLSTRTKMWIAGAAVIVALGVIGNMINSGQVGPPPQVPPQVPPQTPPMTPQFNASGYWLDQSGNRFTVQHDGLNFEARGIVPGTGPVLLRGTLTPAGASFDVFVVSTGARLYQGRGLLPDVRHLNYELRDQRGNITSGQLHINHPPGQ